MAPPIPLARRLAIRVVLLYPEPWRERYGGEVLGLLEDSPVRLSDVGELGRGLIVERARALIEADDRPHRTAFVLVSLQPAFALTFTLLAWALGLALRQWNGGLPSGFGYVGMAGVLTCAVVAQVIDVRQMRRRAPSDPIPPPFPPRIGVTLLPFVFAVILLSSWAGIWAQWENTSARAWGNGARIPFWTHALMYSWWALFAVGRMSSGFWPGRRMLDALGRVAGAEKQRQSAQKWVEGCETMIALGVPSPLATAQAEVDRFSRERDLALETLQGLGYRARFRS